MATENRKYTKEELAKLRSVSVNSGGRTRHTDSGAVLAKTEEKHVAGEHVRETTDVNGSVITEHQDGRQDVNIHAKPLIVSLTQEL